MHVSAWQGVFRAFGWPENNCILFDSWGATRWTTVKMRSRCGAWDGWKRSAGERNATKDDGQRCGRALFSLDCFSRGKTNGRAKWVAKWEGVLDGWLCAPWRDGRGIHPAMVTLHVVCSDKFYFIVRTHFRGVGFSIIVANEVQVFYMH